MRRRQHLVEVTEKLGEGHLVGSGWVQQIEDLVRKVLGLVESSEEIAHLFPPDHAILLQVQAPQRVPRPPVAHPHLVADISHHLTDLFQQLGVHALLEAEESLLRPLIASRRLGWLERRRRSRLALWRWGRHGLLLRDPEAPIVRLSCEAVFQRLVEELMAHLPRADLGQGVVEGIHLLRVQVETSEEGTVLVLRYAVLPRCTETAVGLLRLHEAPGLVLDRRQ
mmetsp:Transcript_12881/g.30622  ORF Transcript_12881/g.30622 Transcript_12881/m.30622 type:complete len:224 (-) Transcript_12881:320-991(-)